MVKKLLWYRFIILLSFFFWTAAVLGQDCPSSVNISANPGTTICAGIEVTFTANITGGDAPVFQWQLNGANVGTNSNSYVNSSLSNTDKVQVIVSSGTTGSTCTKESNILTFTVNPVRFPTVAISTTKSSICPGENITFKASNTHGGTSPQYAWYINSSNSVAKTGESATFSASDFSEGDNTVRVVLTSNVNCANPATAEATSSVFELKPVATISTPTNHDQTVCINKSIENIVFALGGGATNATVTGLPPGVSGSLSGGNYILSGSPGTEGTFSYTVTTTGTCAQITATGTITVNPDATISLTSINNNQTVCAAGSVGGADIDPIIYSIGETGTGASTTGLPTGITGAFDAGIFTISGASSVTGTHNFTVTASGTCGKSPTLSGSITITANVEPSVSITSSAADNEICEGTSVTFTATPTNGGASPSYQWLVNGNTAGSNSNAFSTSSLTDGQRVSVVMTSNETCISENTVTSNEITTFVNPNLVPAVTIAADNSDICAGDEVIFTATPENGGEAPTYEWKIGNSVVGSGNTFSTSSLTDGQSITVKMTSSETCLTTESATSTPIVMEVNENLVPSVSIASNDSNNIICSGGSITFTATPTNGGANPQYQWQINGSASGGVTTSKTYNPTGLVSGDKISAVLISSEECLAENNVVSNEIPVQVDTSISGITPEFDNSNTSHNATAICPVVSDLVYKVKPIEGATSYNWTFPNSGWSIISGNGKNEVLVKAGANASGGNISVEASNECDTSDPISILVTTGTVVHVDAGPDQTVCPGTVQINLNGEIGGVITQKKDWNWSDNGAGGSFKNDKGSDIKGIYTIPNSLRNGGTITISITSIDPPGTCGPKSDSMTLKIETNASITDATNKTQTRCINSAIEDISFIVGGAGQGAEATGLPPGITGTFENGIYTLSGTPTEAGTFNYTVTTTGNCTNAFRSGSITVNPRPTFTPPGAVVVCAGAATSTISLAGSNVSGTTFSWTNDNTAIGLAASGDGDISSFTATNDTNEPIVANITVTPTANNCEGTPEEFQISVYPTATLTKPDNVTVCNGESLEDIIFSGGTVAGSTNKWTNSNTSIGLAAEGTGNILSFPAINTTNSPVQATITVIPVANGCDGTPQEFTITINPTPAFTAPGNHVVCNGEEITLPVFSGETATGTNFSWTNDTPSIGLAASGTGNIYPFTAVNEGTEPVTATITVVPSANVCDGESMDFQVTVNPTTTVNAIDDIVLCNGENFAALNFSSAVSGSSYSWTNTNSEIGLAASGSGNIPAFTAENLTEVASTATITVIPTANECEGIPFSFDIIVNPSATVTAGPDQTICSNGVATMAAILGGGATSGTWTSSGTGSFSDNSVNAVYTPSTPDVQNGSVVLTFTSNDPEGPCTAVSETLELTINEEVHITTQPENTGICSTQPSELTVVASGDNLKYEWKRSDGANIVNSNGIYSSSLSFNNTTSVNAGEYYVVVTGEDSCGGVESERVTINVDENIIIEEPIKEIPICGDGFSEAIMKFIAHANGAPLTFTWFKGNVEVDVDSDPNITITTGAADENGRYEGTLHITNITPAYNGDYHVEINGPEEFTCSKAVTNPFQLRLNEMPELPVVEDLVVCQNETPNNFIVTTGTNLKWYLNEDDVDYIVNEAGQPVAPTPLTDTPGDYYYWVTQEPEACESEKIQVKVTVKEKPILPEVEEIIYYCLGKTADPLSATGATDATLNWYDSEDGEALSSAPVPNTEVGGSTIYWVSQTPNDGFGCESDRAAITVTVHPLPQVTAQVDEEVICLGSPAELSATGGVSYLWFNGEEEIGSGESLSYTPTEAGNFTFTVLVTDGNGCENSTTVEVQVDENTVAGTLSGPASVCVSSPSGTLNLDGYTGDIVRWEVSEDGGVTWTEIASTSATHEFSNLENASSFRAVVKNGVCAELESNEIQIIVDHLPLGGELAFEGTGRVFTICENATGNYAVDLNLSGKQGDIAGWYYRSWDATGYNPLMINEEIFTGSTLSAAQIQAFGFNVTTVFQVEVNSGACSPNALSKTAILSVIPSDITPSPVTVDPGVVCLGEEVTLSSETGYETGGSILDQGAFDNASITNHGWRIRRGGNTTDLGFDTDANNTEFDRWKRGTPRKFITASTTSPYSTSGILFDTGIEDGNKGFALVSAKNSSTMETPVFTIGSMDQAILTFDQAYVLTPGASLKVEISTDGGNTYTTLYIREVPVDATQGFASGNTSSFGTGTLLTTPENKIMIDLGDYMGRSNLRIRFNYTGARSGDIWAVDNIDIPEGPNGITMEWRDYTDPAYPEGVFIGTNNSENWPPTKVGLNVFEVKTKLVFNSNGDACEVAENAQRVEVFVFDQYTSETTAIVGSCGNLTAQLQATVTNAAGKIFTSFPTPDGYVGQWKIEGATLGYTLIDSNPDDEIDAENDPNAIITVDSEGTFKASYVLSPTTRDEGGVLYENKDCKPVAPTHDVEFKACSTLDFDGVDDYVDLGEGYTGDYSIEAWIRPEASTGTIISTPNLEINMSDLPAGITPNSRWYHIAVDSDGKLYVDGIDAGKTIIKTGTERAFIGARWNSPNAENHFSGWIEEVRIWNGKITPENIRFTMNQRLKSDGNIGVEVDMDHPDSPDYKNLAGYYRLIATEILNGGYTEDLSNSPVNGKLRNMETSQENTAPLPYTTSADGRWNEEDGPLTNLEQSGPWTHWEVWDIPNAKGIDNTTPIEWNIVRTSNNVTSGDKDIKVLGLIVESAMLEIADPATAVPFWTNLGQMLRVTHYLKLNGFIDLNGESQLLQNSRSIIDPVSTGRIEIDQQGTASSFNYNYWTSPVSIGVGHPDYSIKAVMKDGTVAVPVDLDFAYSYSYADGLPATPRKVSSYWLYKHRGDTHVYAQWHYVGENGPVGVGEGYSMKGTDGISEISDRQNYTFKGMPNNGDISLTLGANQGYLTGNPYPSALDAHQFILDHLDKDLVAGATNDRNVFNGTLYFWSHFAGHSHYLEEYVGGYAPYNLSGGAKPYSTDERIDNTDPKESGDLIPEDYIPVGQAFMLNTKIDTTMTFNGVISGGTIQFKNSLREFHRESEGSSVFLSQERKSKKSASEKRQKIWLNFKSPQSYSRQLLITADPLTTNSFDLGYDAPLIENNKEDMYWIFDAAKFVIQGVPHFNENQEFPLGIKVQKEEKFTISIDNLKNFPDGKPIYLKDSLLNVFHNLREGSYEATAPVGVIDDRFKIVFKIPDPDVVVDLPDEDDEVAEEEENDDLEKFTGIELMYLASTREILIRNPELVGIQEMLLNNLLGQKVHEFFDLPLQEEVKLPVRRLSSGVYVVRLETERGVFTEKIILE